LRGGDLEIEWADVIRSDWVLEDKVLATI